VIAGGAWSFAGESRGGMRCRAFARRLPAMARVAFVMMRLA